MPTDPPASDSLSRFHPAVSEWFQATFQEPTPPQRLGWPAIMSGASTLILAPTGMGKTLTAFLASLDRLMFKREARGEPACRVVYVSPLKALAIDVERNLQTPLSGIAQVASARGDGFHMPSIALRTGDTPQRERAQFARRPADILITTPESLYLLLTSRARRALAQVECVIIDEIHALVPEKRGVHLALSLERLERLTRAPLQRIGLSATAHPAEEVARFLGGAVSSQDAAAARAAKRRASPKAARTAALEAAVSGALDEFTHEAEASPANIRYRPVEIIRAAAPKALAVSIEVPVEDMRSLEQLEASVSGPPSIWNAIHPRLLALVREHNSTLIFANARRSAERLAGALNELAGETLAYAHHGSLSREQRVEVEERLKTGQAKALVATSSLELGIDMAAIDLVVQIESPPSVASGLQRVGRAGHGVGQESAGVIFPKYRGDLLVCAALSRAMLTGAVEAVRYPRNSLDVLAQQIVAILSEAPLSVDDLYALVRGAAAYAELPRALFESVLDMLAGRYQSDDFAQLKPRITWDRASGVLSARQGAQAIAIANGGTIPDRGLYAVYLASVERRGARLGELDEEMVFESKPGETFVLGASSWRIEEITHDRVLVSPAPGEPGKMPFWRGEAKGRSLELGRSIGVLTRELCTTPADAALTRLTHGHGLQPRAAENLLRYLADQQRATRSVPDDRTFVIESCRDELGNYRVCLLSPWGSRVHAPWALAAVARIRRERNLDVECMWTDDGFVVRMPDSDVRPSADWLVPRSDELDDLLLQQLGQSALFAARFRENAARALLLPRRRPGQRTPLWQQRKRAADLLAVAAQYPSFPLLLETYRECLRDVFDVPALALLLRGVEQGELRVAQVETETPSPFASALLFGFVANYLYEGDAPLAERRAQALRIDQRQLRELLGDAELRDLLDPAVLAAVTAQLQLQDPSYRIEHADALHDALLRIGDLSPAEIRARTADGCDAQGLIDELARAQRIISVQLGRPPEPRYIAVEDAARYRDALGVTLPSLPEALLEPPREPLRDLLLRYARTHGPFTLAEVAARFALGTSVVQSQLERLESEGKVLEGAFRPGGDQREYAHAEVLRSLRQRSLAKLRKEIEPVSPAVFGRFLTHWHGLVQPRAGLDAVLDAVERLQGAALPFSVLEREILPARVAGFRPEDLDALASAGEIVWCGVESLGERDGRVALYLTDQFPRLWAPPTAELDERETRILQLLAARGACFFGPLHSALGAGFPQTTLDALFSLVWKGLVTNDTFAALRSYAQARLPRHEERRAARLRRSSFRSRREAPRAAEGRWSALSALADSHLAGPPTPTERANSWAELLLRRHGLVTREVAQSERIGGGWSGLYEVYRACEDAGRIRRGYFVQDISAMQFALPSVLDQLRALREPPKEPEVLALAATDPANPYGALLKWPSNPEGRAPARAAQASVILVDGALAAYVARGGKQLQVFLPPADPERTRSASAVAAKLRALASDPERGLLLAEIDGQRAEDHPFAEQLRAAGFQGSSQGFYLPRTARDPKPKTPLFPL